jgi:hypothetical protein
LGIVFVFVGKKDAVVWGDPFVNICGASILLLLLLQKESITDMRIGGGNACQLNITPRQSCSPHA